MTHQTTSLRPFLTEFIHFDRRATLIALLMNLAGAMVEGLGIVLLLPLLTLAGVFSGSGAPPLPLTLHPALTQWLEHTPQEHKLLLMLSLFVSLIALQSGISLRREQLTHRLQLRFVDHLRIALFGALAQARWRFLAQHHSSEFLSVLTTDISRVGVGALFLLQLFTQFALFSAYLIVAFGLSPQITGLALLTGAGLWWVLRSTRDIAKQGGVLLSRTNQHLFNEIQEFLGALKLIKIHDETAGYQQQFRHVIERLRQQQLAFSQVRAQTQSAFRIGSALALAVLTYAALTWARLPAAELLVLIAVFSRMLPQMSSIHIGLQQLWHMTPAFENWRRWMALCRAAREPVATLSSIRPLVDGLRLREVRYRYPNGTRTFTIPDLCIPARRTTAVIGPTGSGKTTLLDLLCGLNEPQAGAITADGEALQADTGWRRRLAYIPQETSILDGTLRDNLSWGAMTASDERMFAALDSAAAGEFARRLPNGLDTWVGERGVRLSGGEKQRVALARALLREPELLILDEATSALDTEHQQIILEALRTLHGRTTVVIVTHRFEEIRHLLDGLVRIEDGVVGPWTAL